MLRTTFLDATLELADRIRGGVHASESTSKKRRQIHKESSDTMRLHGTQTKRGQSRPASVAIRNCDTRRGLYVPHIDQRGTKTTESGVCKTQR